ncbi:MAG: hypothetical protein IKE73_01030 [Bacilli bacterium]|nr:hypothetical protein [Bacilli bacterium]
MDNSEKEMVKLASEKKEKKEKKSSVKKDKKIKLFVLCIIILAIGVIGYNIIKNLSGDDIKDVDRILKEKYYEVKCLDSNCSQIVAYKGDKKGKTKVTLFNGDGKSVASYKTSYDVKAKETKEPYAVADNYFLNKIVNTSKKEITNYSIADKKGKEVYKTNNVLKILTNYLVVEDDTTKGINSYTIINNKGNAIFKNVNDYNSFANNRVAYIDVNGSKELLDDKGNVLKSGYTVAREVADDNGDTLYLILRETKNSSYSLFNVEKGKVVSDSFQNYVVNEDKSLTISKKENNQIVQYKLNKNGKEEKIGVTKTQSQIVSELRSQIDEKKYSIYTASLTSEKQKYVFTDDLEGKSFGVYNIKKKEYNKIFDYDKEATNVYSTIYALNGENGKKYYQISCDKKLCGEAKFYVYDIDNNKALYTTSSEDSIIQNYYQYTNDYKVLKYSFSSTNTEKKGKYILLDKENKEIITSENGIVVLNEELLFGKKLNSSLLIFSTKDNKKLNDDNSLATLVNVNDNTFYKYSDGKNTTLVNEKGKKVLEIDSKIDLIYSDKLIVYVDKNIVNIFNSSNSKIKKYKLKENEKMNTASGSIISPYRGALFINNSNDNYVKIVNKKGKIIKKIKKAEIENVYYNNQKNVVIITKNDTGKTDLYGLYIAK